MKMNAVPRRLPIEPNISTGVRTMENLLEAVLADTSLSTSQRRNWPSAIRRLCEMLDLPLATTPANTIFLRRKLKSFHPKQADCKRGRLRATTPISTKTFQNIRSAVLAALDRYTEHNRPHRGAPLTPEWRSLSSTLQTDHLRYGLSRLIRFCNANAIAPEAVDDEAANQLLNWLVNDTLVEHPKQVHSRCLACWNKAVETVPGWPPRRLTTLKRPKGYALSWDDLPVGLRQDAEAWLAVSSGMDPFSAKGPRRPYSDVTVKAYQYSIRQLVSALAHQGLDLSTLESLNGLVQPDIAEKALRFFYARAGNKPTSQTGRLAALLCTIAEHWSGIDDERLARLKGFRSRLSIRRAGLTDKNRMRLQQFTDTHNIEKLLMFPSRVLDRLRRHNKVTVADTSLMTVALMTEILLMMPARRKNLVMLRLDRHFSFMGSGRNRRVFVNIPADEVKNAQDLCFPLPAETVVLLDVYCQRYRPLLATADNPWLFPGASPNTHKSLDQASRSFSKTIWRETGLELNMHLMRHVGAKLYLDRNPGQYEVVRRVLAHKSISTTTANYTGLETEATFRHYDSVILRIRDAVNKDIERG